MPLIKIPFNAFKEVERMLKYKFWDKERERSNRATSLNQLAEGTKRLCPLRHQKIAWSGPPHDIVRSYVCLLCNARASEPEIKDRGYDFDLVGDWIIKDILDLDLQRQAEGRVSQLFSGFDT